jgi:peroxiredoxin
MVIFRRFLVFLCLLSIGFAQHTPRACADFPIRTTDHKVIKISQYHGKVLMIAMFLTTCDDCLNTLHFMDKLQTELGPRGFQAIGLSLDESAALVSLYAQRYRFPFPLAHLDKDEAIKLADLKPTAHPVVPYIMFVDWMGQVRFQYAGNDPVFNSAEKNLRAVADGLLRQAAEKKGATYETKPAPPKK